jgi:hypothetical protein
MNLAFDLPGLRENWEQNFGQLEPKASVG